MLQEGFRHAFQVGAEGIVAPAVEGRSAFVLAAADADHLQQTRFVFIFKVRMRFNLVEQDDAVGFIGILVTVYGEAVFQCGHFDDVHRRQDGDA